MIALSETVFSLLQHLSSDFYVGKEPTSPNNCVTIYDTGGREQNDRLALNEATVQIRSRNVSYSAGYNVLELVRLNMADYALDNAANPDADLERLNEDTFIVGIWCMTPVTFLMYDDNDRAIFTINYRIVRQDSSTDDARLAS